MAFALAHNGGKSQLNLGSIPHNGDYPFINVVKQFPSWNSRSPDAPIDPDILDVNGYPTQDINAQGYYSFVAIPRQADKPGEWILEWDGNGVMVNPFVTNPTSGSLTSTTGSGRATGVPWNNKLVIGPSSISPSPNHIRNIRFYHSSEATRFANGEMFGADFLAVLRELNPGVIRFMDWFSNNTNNIPNWTARKSVNFFSYYASEYRGAAWGSANKWYFGITAGTPNNYTITTTRGRAPIHGDIIQLHFHADAVKSGLCSLNVDGFGAKNILSEFALPLSTGGNSYPERFAFSDVNQIGYATLVFDAVANAWIKQGGDIAQNASGLSNACPPEVAFRLAAELGMHPSLTTPVQTIDPLSDYMIQLATYCRDNAPSWMIPRYESPNEVFNTFSGFYNNGWVMNHSNAYGWVDWEPVVGKFLSVFGQALNTVYSNDRTKFKLLAGVQTVLGGSGHASLLTSAEYVAQAAPAQSPYNKSAASNYVHGMLGANYFNPSTNGGAGEVTLANAFAGGDQTAPATYVSQVYNTSPGFTIPRNVSDFTAWKSFALSHGCHELHFYEGGYSPDYDGNTVLDNLREASKYVPALKQAILDDYNGILALTDANFTVMFPSHYYLSGNKYLDGQPASYSPTLGTRYSAWSLLEDIYQMPRPPEYLAIVQFNAVANGGGSPPPPPASLSVHFRLKRA